MNIYVYSDESGVFDNVHEDKFVFGGLIFLDKNTKDIETRKYLNVERTIRKYNRNKYQNKELKATILKNKDKGKVFRSLNSCIKFSVVIDLKRVNIEIFNHKKSKQRYLDYAFKIGVKRAIEKLILEGAITPNEVNSLNIFCDEHTTATNGFYQLKEGLEEEFKRGTHNFHYNKFFPPLFPNMNNVNLQYCNSATNALIRGADIVANRVYFKANKNNCSDLHSKVICTHLP